MIFKTVSDPLILTINVTAPDTVRIARAEYDASKHSLRTEATGSDTSARLTVLRHRQQCVYRRFDQSGERQVPRGALLAGQSGEYHR